jgi:hypothetical protein
MKIKCLYDKLVPVEDLKPNPKNPNKHSKSQIKTIADILDYQGWRLPIKVSRLSGMVTSGHGRIEAAKLNNWKEVPVNYQEYESPEQEYADLVADNTLAALAELDRDMVMFEAEKMPELDIKLLAMKEKQEIKIEKLDLSDKLYETYELVLSFKNENELESAFMKFSEEGYQCRTLIL